MNRFLAALALAATCTTAYAASVTVGDRQWRQLTDTTGFTWNQVATVCDAVTGTCSGSLGAVSFDGWTWADNTDIQALFEALILPGSEQFPTATSDYETGAYIFDIDVAVGLFTPTSVFLRSDSVDGWSRSMATSSNAYVPFLAQVRATGGLSSAYLSMSYLTNSARPYPTGVWLYQPATPVPLPAAAWLFGGALGALGWIRRRAASSPDVSTRRWRPASRATA